MIEAWCFSRISTHHDFAVTVKKTIIILRTGRTVLIAVLSSPNRERYKNLSCSTGDSPPVWLSDENSGDRFACFPDWPQWVILGPQSRFSAALRDLAWRLSEDISTKWFLFHWKTMVRSFSQTFYALLWAVFVKNLPFRGSQAFPRIPCFFS